MFNLSPLNQRRIKAFKNNKKGYIAFWIFTILFIFSLFAELIANDKPLIISYKNKIYTPILNDYNETEFGGDFPTPTDYKDLYIRKNIEDNGFIIWAPIKFSYNTINYELDTPTPAPPSTNNIFGTDDEGRDIFARIIYGFRLSIIFAFLLTIMSSTIGIIIGAVQGYFGGKLDIILQRLIEIWESLPQLFILIIMASLFTPSFWTLLLVLLLFSWTELVNVVRAEFLRTRNFEFVTAAKALGASNKTIIFRHILPNAIIATITFIPFILCASIISLTALDFLGLGLPSNYPSLGDLVRQGKENLHAPWIGVSIFIILSLILSLLLFIGEAIRDAFDSRKNK